MIRHGFPLISVLGLELTVRALCACFVQTSIINIFS